MSTIFKTNQELKHIDLAKTLIDKNLYQEAFDHYKISINQNKECSFDILSFLYKKHIQKTDMQVNISILISKYTP